MSLPPPSPANKPKSTRQLLVKCSGATGLYRHSGTGMYYGMKKVRGKRREHSLDTMDRKIAERRYADWARSLEKTDREVERTTMAELIERFIAVNGGKSDKTKKTNRSVIKCFTETWRYGLSIEARQVHPSMLDEWLALHERRLKNTTYNRYAGFLKQLFEIAAKDRIIAESPFAGVSTRWKKPQKPIRRVPTEDQFRAIVRCIREQPFTDHAKDSADFVDFLGAAGLGQAEAGSLAWGDIDWQRNSLSVRRHKTGTRFTVPLYPQLKDLLLRLKASEGRPAPTALVFKIKDAKKALATACRALGLPAFTQRNMRQCAIRRLWKAGVDVKLIARWQGHIDGGELIINTYTEVFGADDAEYERMQLAKLSPPVNIVPPPGTGEPTPQGEPSTEGAVA